MADGRRRCKQCRRDHKRLKHRGILQLPAQEGVACAICGKLSSQFQRLDADHDHDTGKFRGWLCRRCNWSVAYVERVGVAAFLRYVADKIVISAAYDRRSRGNNVS